VAEVEVQCKQLALDQELVLVDLEMEDLHLVMVAVVLVELEIIKLVETVLKE
jgi:hypothetical protein